MLTAILLLAQDGQAILDAVERARPDEALLAPYRLEWSPTLKDALASAEKNPRPIFVFATRQLEDAGSLFSGHC